MFFEFKLQFGNLKTREMEDSRMDHGDHGMIMYFHKGGMIHGFLFKDWMLHNENDHMKAGFVLFFAAFFYEGLKATRKNQIFN